MTSVVDFSTNYVRISGLQLVSTSTSNTTYMVRQDGLNGSGGYFVIDSNILWSQIGAATSSDVGIQIGNASVNPTNVITNNIIYGLGNLAVGVDITAGGTGNNYIYNNTEYASGVGYRTSNNVNVTFKNNIAQGDTTNGFGLFRFKHLVVDPASTDNISNTNDATGTNPQSKTMTSLMWLQITFISL